MSDAEDERDVEEVDLCEACGGPLELLGVLGTIAHYRCRNCGLDARALPAPESADDDDEDELYDELKRANEWED